MTRMNVIAMGVHVLDVHVRPVDGIPARSDGQIVDEIVIPAAATAGGTATILRKLGAEVRSFGAVGTDPLGDMLVTLLRDAGVDTTHLVRRSSTQTSASVIPVRPNGDRPACWSGSWPKHPGASWRVQGPSRRQLRRRARSRDARPPGPRHWAWGQSSPHRPRNRRRYSTWASTPAPEPQS